MIRKFRKYKGEYLYSLSSYSTPLVTMITNVISAAFLKPNELGTIQSVMLLVPYLAFMHLGVFNGLNRNLALYRAQKNDAKVQQIVNASFTVAIVNSIIGLIIGLVYLINYSVFHHSKIYFFSSILLCVNLIFNPFITHFETTYRSSQSFGTLGKITLVENLVYTITNLLPIWIGYFGKLIANGIRVILRFFLRFHTQPYRSNAFGKLKDILELIRVGAPLLIGGYLFGIIQVSDQTMIAKYLGPENLGFYSLSIFLMSAVTVIPASINTLLYPKASSHYGKTKSNRALSKFFWKSLFINIGVLIPICLMLYFLIEPLTMFFLPNYIGGIGAAKINLLTCITFVSNGPSIIIGVVRRNKTLIFVYIISLLFIWLFASIIDSQSINIELFAWLRFFVSLMISVFTLLYSYYLTTIDEYKA